MLNLTEAWKEAYSEYLKEQEENLTNEIDVTLVELTEAQQEAQAGFSMLREYYEIFALSEGVTLTETPGDAPVGSTATVDKNGNINVNYNNRSDKDYSKPSKELVKYLTGTLQHPEDLELGDYKAQSTFEISSIQDMKFPKNVIFFIGQLIKWIRNLVLYFIEKFKNLIRRLVGAQPKELNPDSIKLNLTNVRKLETISTAMGGKVGDGIVSARRIDMSKIENASLREGFAETLGIVKSSDKEAIKTQPIVITIDFARDIQNIRQLVDHFYKLFDSAYGSANEHLFSTDDLEIILNIFNDTITRLKTGDIQQYSVSGGVAVDASGVNSQRVKQNLQLTNQNLTALKQAYTQTAEKITDIAKIVNSKEIMMLSDIGASYRLLTSETYNQISGILETMPDRLKKATEMERKMAKMKSEYSKLVTELQSMQRSFASVSNITFDTIYNRKVIDLLNAASWMSDTVSLRLAGIGLYIKELKDVRDALVMVSNLNAGPHGGKLKDFIEASERAKLSNKLYKYD